MKCSIEIKSFWSKLNYQLNNEASWRQWQPVFIKNESQPSKWYFKLSNPEPKQTSTPKSVPIKKTRTRVVKPPPSSVTLLCSWLCDYWLQLNRTLCIHLRLWLSVTFICFVSEVSSLQKRGDVRIYESCITSHVTCSLLWSLKSVATGHLVYESHARLISDGNTL